MRVGTVAWRVGGGIAARTDRLSDRTFAFLCMLPGILVVALVVLPPIVAAFGLSFWRVEFARDLNTPFVGLRNFERMLADDLFLASIPRTILFAIATTALTLPLALVTALIVNRGTTGSRLLGVAMLLPWAVAPVVTGLYWNFIFNGNFGLATGVMMGLGLTDKPIPWLQSTSTAVAIAVIGTAWRWVPLMALLILANLRTIPESQYRAARMDGASRWQAFRHITLPAIRNTLLVVGILQVILSLQVFDLLYLLTGGGPGRETTVMSYYIYERMVLNLSFGYSSAMALVLTLITLVFSGALLYLRLRDRPDRAQEDEPDALPAPPPPVASVQASAPVAAVANAQRPRLRVPGWVPRIGVLLVTAILFLWFVGPVAWMTVASLQPEGAVTTAPPQLTTDIRVDRYLSLLEDPRWQSSLLVSLEVTIATTLIVLALAALAAFPLARLNVPGRGLLMVVLIVTQMVPAIVLVIPVLMVFQRIGLKDTPLALVIVNVAFWLPLIIWLLRNVIQDVPRSLESAARMDGCSRLGSLFRVVVPAARPGIAAAAILVLIGTWNEFLFAVVLGDRNAVTMTRRISQLQVIGSAGGIPPYTLVAAAGVLVALPCLLLVLGFHRRIVTGLTEGFVKG
jgi:ABC-type sugar transport system permease subunit